MEKFKLKVKFKSDEEYNFGHILGKKIQLENDKYYKGSRTFRYETDYCHRTIVYSGRDTTTLYNLVQDLPNK